MLSKIKPQHISITLGTLVFGGTLIYLEFFEADGILSKEDPYYFQIGFLLMSSALLIVIGLIPGTFGEVYKKQGRSGLIAAIVATVIAQALAIWFRRF